MGEAEIGVEVGIWGDRCGVGVEREGEVTVEVGVEGGRLMYKIKYG